MIQANEFRIGNFLFSNDKIISIDSSSISYLEEVEGDSIYDPIPLTEEWLLKFGFEKWGIWMKKNPLWIGRSKTQIAGDGVDINTKHCEFVHQLQNLYFALTGKELNYAE